MVNCVKKSKKVRKSKGFFKSYVENHVENVDKKHNVFPQKCVEKKIRKMISLFGDLWKFAKRIFG